MTAMDLDIDRLILELPDLPAGEAQRLARLVAECLASAEAPGAALRFDRLRVSLPLHPRDSLPATAQRIAGAVLGALARSSS
jgi:hypothetical protein